MVFTRKAYVGEISIRKSTNICKSIVGTDASQLYPFSACQHKFTGLITLCDLDPDTSSFAPRQHKTRSFENMVMSYFQRTRPVCRIESCYTKSRRQKLTTSVLIAFFLIATLCLKLWVAFITFLLVKRNVHLSLKKILNVVVRKEDWDETRRNYIQENGFTVLEMS